MKSTEMCVFPVGTYVWKCIVAEIFGNLWEHNLCRVVVVDVSDDYRLMQPPMPSDFYPVLREVWMPRYLLSQKLPSESLVTGYLYDWHESGDGMSACWYVGVVSEDLAAQGSLGH